MATVILVRHGRTTANTSRRPRRAAAGSAPRRRRPRAGGARPGSGSRRCRWPRSSPARSSAAGRPREAIARGPAGAAGRGSHRARASPSATTATGRAGRSRSWPRSKLWKTVQRQPVGGRRSRAASRWPAMQARAVDAVRRHDAARRGRARRRARCGWRSATATSSSRSWPTRSGMHLDLFQRIHVDPASVSIVRYTRDAAVRARDQHPRRRPVLAGAAGRRKSAATPASPAATRRRAAAAPGLWAPAHRVDDMPRSSTASTRPSASSPAPSASPGSARSSSRPASGARVVSVALEKQQVAVLAERIDELLDEVMAEPAHASA